MKMRGMEGIFMLDCVVLFMKLIRLLFLFQMLFISLEDMEHAINKFRDEDESLEYRLWHVCANRIAANILMKQATYQVSNEIHVLWYECFNYYFYWLTILSANVTGYKSYIFYHIRSKWPIRVDTY